MTPEQVTPRQKELLVRLGVKAEAIADAWDNEQGPAFPTAADLDAVIERRSRELADLQREFAEIMGRELHR